MEKRRFSGKTKFNTKEQIKYFILARVPEIEYSIMKKKV